MNTTKKSRLQFDFSEDAVKRLDNLVKMTNSVSRAETIRNALVLLEFIFKYLKDGYELVMKKDDKNVTVVFPWI